MTEIDLRPIAGNRAAVEVILQARGQLNLAFRQRGLLPPDPLPTGLPHQFRMTADAEGRAFDLDDPVRFGIEHALDTYGTAFLDWSAGMPGKLLSPVLAILGRTLSALQAAVPQDGAAIKAVEDACDHLLAQAPRPG